MQISFIAFITTSIIIYLSFAYVNLETNLFNWEDGVRKGFVLTFLLGNAAAIFYGCMILNIKENE